MATMKDNQPDIYEGEKRVWQCINDNLPDDIVCYYNREVKGKEFDFCLLILRLMSICRNITVQIMNLSLKNYPV